MPTLGIKGKGNDFQARGQLRIAGIARRRYERAVQDLSVKVLRRMKGIAQNIVGVVDRMEASFLIEGGVDQRADIFGAAFGFWGGLSVVKDLGDPCGRAQCYRGHGPGATKKESKKGERKNNFLFNRKPSLRTRQFRD